MARIIDILSEVDELKPNTYEDAQKIKWISTVEAGLYRDVYETHEHEEEIEFNGYSEDDMNTELWLPDSYADIYTYYVMALMDFHNGEIERYNNSIIMYMTALNDFKAWYNRTHTPISRELKLF